MLASKKNGVLYIGVTNNLVKRVTEHKSKQVSGFTKEYWVHRLVWFSETNDINEAILKEKQMKKWNRAWKIKLIEEKNPKWEDLFSSSAF
jgi:putative endonuclease